MKSKKKEDLEEIKKTIEAHGTFSEEEAEEKAEDFLEIAEELIEEKILDAKKPEEIQVLKKDFRGKPTTEVWHPKTKLGEEVRAGRVKNLDEILEGGKKILEPEIVDYLVELKSDLISIGQSKGKFGGGKRRAWRQTQRKTKEGNVPTFSTMAAVGDEMGHVGIGTGKAKETLPSRDKAVRKAKLGIIKVERACSSFDCSCKEPHTIPFKITGKSGSVRITLIPAPQGTGIVAGNEIKKILKLAGIKDIYSRSTGKIRTSFNLAKACIDALKKTTRK
ncbi:MAG: 30S ribosomal protein S5 [Nanoarchaeota archaeon]